MRGLHVTPCQGVEAVDIRGVAAIGVFIDVDLLSFAANIVDGDEDRKYDADDRNKYDQQCLEVSEEEVGIETTFLNDFSVAKVEQVFEESNHRSRRRICSFSLRYEVGLGFTRESRSVIVGKG